MLKKIKTILDSKFRQENDNTPGDPHMLSAGQHGISPKKISDGARKIVAELSSAGYEAYVVGGCVRDILLNLHPKDFDVATDATPEQVKQLFNRARIVGRRFQIVHVRMGREVIEVTTFRAHHQSSDSKNSDNKSSGNKRLNKKHQKEKSRRSDKGLLLRDNIFGTIDEDASRRDFSMNALYYHPQDNSLYDFANGIEDIKQRTIRIIGDPKLRYREDPVRMLRAVRFAAKLGFDIEPSTAAPIKKLGKLLHEIPPARLFDECLKLFMNGHALATFHLLREFDLFGKLFPETDHCLNNNPEDWMLPFVELALTNTDKRIRADKGVTPAFLFAALLWPMQKKRSDHFVKQGEPPLYAMQRASAETVSRQCQHISIPKRFSIPMREIWEMQLRLPKRRGKQAERLMENKRFRAGYDFLLLREDVNEIQPGLGDWWTRYQEVNHEQRTEMVANLSKDEKPGGRRRKRRPRRRQPNTQPQNPQD